MTEISVAKSFFQSAGKLSSNARARVFDFMFKFYNNPASPGLSVERVQDALDANMWSARITGGLRAIYHQLGELYTLLYAGQHDDAYDWAGRRRLEKHSVTRDLQLVETTEVVEQVIAESPGPAEAVPLLAEHGDDYLLSLGVPEDWLPTVRKIRTEEQLLTAVERLPEEVGERLVSLAAGEFVTPPKPAAPNEPIAANPDNLRRFWVVQDAAELQAILDKPLEDWIRFLHPSQRELTTARFNGPVKVTGSAGTGKTVVAIHRANQLAIQGKQVLLTSFVTTLCRNIDRNLDLLCNPAHRSRIIAATVHSQALKIARQVQKDLQAAEDQFVAALIERFQDYGGAMFDRDFLVAEWNGVVENQGIVSWDEYRDVKRIGRGKGLQVRERRMIWKVFERVLSQLSSKGTAPWPMICRQAREALESSRVQSPYDAVIVDEVQDLKPQEIRFLAALAKAHGGDLLLVGDAGQRIYPGGYSLRSLGIDVRGRSKILRINYRTTEQIRRFADDLLPERGDDLDEGEESRKGTRSLLHGPAPVLRGFKNRDEQDQFILQTVRRLLDQGLKPHEIGVFSRVGARYEPLCQAFEADGLPVSLLARDDQDLGLAGGIRFGTMHRAKGLEFKVVFAYDCSEGTMPHEGTLRRYKDPADYESALARERQLLYVTITRARDEAYVTWTGLASPFLPSDKTGSDSQ